MDATTASARLEIRRTFNCPAEKVFQAWADQQALAQWMGPVDDMEVIVEEHDFRPDGAYRYRMITRHDDPIRGPAGLHNVVGGKFLEIDAPKKLIFTWRWLENGMDVGDSLVTLIFHSQGEQCELVLLHERLPGPEARDAHRDGWEGCLACLARYLSA